MALEMTGRGHVAFVCPCPPLPLFSEANIECGQWMRRRKVRELTGSISEYSMLGVKARASCIRGKHSIIIPHPSSQKA